MTPQSVNWLNSLILIAAGIYGYFLLPIGPEEKRSITALIPAFFGAILMVLGFLWSKSPKIVAHVAVTLALLLLVMCFMRFMKIEDWGAKKYLFLACIMSNAFAVFVFVRSFIAARATRLS